jgi:hypothetical protein
MNNVNDLKVQNLLEFSEWLKINKDYIEYLAENMWTDGY